VIFESQNSDSPGQGELSWVRDLRNNPWIARATSHIPPAEFGRYLVVGTFNTLFGYSTFAALTALIGQIVPFSYVLATLISSPINITVAFLGYKWFVFRTKGNYVKEWTRCVAVYASGILGGMVLLPILVAALHYGCGMRKSAPYLAGALLMIFGVIYNFFGLKRFSFRNLRNGDRR
jgi:putative flippase GtrA